MNAWFWIDQAGWLAFLACGVYVSFCFWNLSKEESARKAELEKHLPQNARRASDPRSFILSALD